MISMDMKLFNDIEKKYDLNTVNYDGFYYWNYFRYSIAVTIQNPLEDCYRDVWKKRLLFKRFSYSRFIEILKKSFVRKRKTDVLCVQYGSSRIPYHSLFFDIYVDDILDSFPDAVDFELCNSKYKN